MSKEAGFRVPDGNHAFLKRGPSAVSVDSAVELPKAWTTPYDVPLVGFTGYDTEESRN